MNGTVLANKTRVRARCHHLLYICQCWSVLNMLTTYHAFSFSLSVLVIKYKCNRGPHDPVKTYCMCILKTMLNRTKGLFWGRGGERVFLFVYVLAFDVEFACEVNRGTHPVIRLSKGPCAPAASSSEDRVQSR